MIGLGNLKVTKEDFKKNIEQKKIKEKILEENLKQEDSKKNIEQKKIKEKILEENLKQEDSKQKEKKQLEQDL